MAAPPRLSLASLSAPRDAICLASKPHGSLGTKVKRESLVGQVTYSRAMRLPLLWPQKEWVLPM